MKAEANILEYMLTFQTAVSQKECFCGCCKRHGQSSSGRQDFIWLPGPRHSPSRREVRAGPWRQELTQRIWRVLLAGLLSRACSACFLIQPRTLVQEWPTSIINHENAPRGFPTGHSDGGIFLNPCSLFPDDPVGVKLTKANQHRCDLTTLAPITMFNYPHYDEQRFRSNVTLNSSLLQKQLFRAGV